MAYKNKAIKQLRHKEWRDENRVRWGNIDPRSIFIGKKFCSKCRLEKDPFDFAKDLGLKEGIHAWCKKCHTQNTRRAKYGWELPDDSQCDICGEPATDVDHDKEVERIYSVRGFLCGKCNRGLGNFLHNPWLLREAAWYLEHPLESFKKNVKVVEV